VARVAAELSLINLVQDSSVYCLLGITFGRSLLPAGWHCAPSWPIGARSPIVDEVRYTRRVTAAWTAFFFLITTVSILLYVWAPLRIWSVFINFCVLPLGGAMFIAEYQIRRRILPGSAPVCWRRLRVYLAASRQEPV